MTHTKLLIRHLAYVPWLLAIGLVLGWSGKAVATSSATSGHSTENNHPHATNPSLVLTYDLLASGANHSITVRWSTSQSRNFSTGNGTAATGYAVKLYSGEIDSDLSSPSDTEIGSEQSYSGATLGTRTYTFTDADIKHENQEEGATGKYWVRIAVTVASTDASHTSSVEYFAKQITLRADYILSVNPNSVREDARRTEVTVKVKVGNDEAVGKNTNVNLEFDSPDDKLGLNDRFYIELPTLTIPKNKKEATGTIVFTPISEDTENEDLTITIKGIATAQEAVKSTSIELVDTDKQTDEINLSFSDADLSRRDNRATDIVVTATLNGKKQRKDLRFSLVIDETRGGLTRDEDYTAIMASITIPDRKVSGRATITIRPKNEGTGEIWVEAPADAGLTNDDDNPITINPNSIEITGDPGKVITGLTAAPSSIREDAGAKEITLKVSLQNALLADERVRFTITDESDNLGEAFEGAVDAERDVDYAAEVRSLTIRKGKKEGTTTIVVTPINNKDDDPPRAFTVNARVGNNESLFTGILITDDDTTSDSITLEVSPDEINEGAGPTEVTVTGTLNGKVFADDVVVPLVIDNDVNGDGEVDDDDEAATRDADYTADLHPLVIPGGSVSGTTTITVTPTANDGEEDDEKFRLATLASKLPRANDEDGDPQELEVTPATITLKDTKDAGPQTRPPDPKIPAFTAADAIADQEYAVGTAIAALVLPEATGGDTTLTYSVSTLPAGLAFNAATRTLSGTPTVAGTFAIVYTVIDSDGDADALTFSIAIEAAETPPLPVADAELTAAPSSVREDAETTQILLTVVMAAPKATAERVTFMLVGPSAGTPAVRDLNYTAVLGAVATIPAGTTVGTTTLTLTPIDNAEANGPRVLGVQATFASDAIALTDIEIADDETPSTSISLSASPRTISEEGGETTITVTATLDGKALARDAAVTVSIDGASTAARDVDYIALFKPLLVIPAGSITGSTRFTVHPIDDTVAEGNETIKLTGAIVGLAGSEVEITLSDRATVEPPQEPVPPQEPAPEPEDSSLAFAADAAIADQEYTAEGAIAALVLPAALGGTGSFTYSVSALPAGLSFDATTRTIAGTPAKATDGAVVITYTAIDSDGAAAALTFSITVNPPLSFASFFDLFGSVSGKVIPTASHDLAEIREFVVGQRVEGLTLPEGTGGTAPLTYHLSPALPAGLSFDAATRTVAGTPLAESAPVYTYAVTDANGVRASLSLQTLPAAFALANNFPNPFNPATTIQYALPQAADVKLTVYNVVGQPVRALVAEHQSAGRYVVEWDATDDSGHSLSSGMYFYRLQAGGEFAAVKKMLLLK